MEVGENAVQIAETLITATGGNNWAQVILLVVVIVGVATNTFMAYRRMQANERLFGRLLDMVKPVESASKRK